MAVTAPSHLMFFRHRFFFFILLLLTSDASNRIDDIHMGINNMYGSTRIKKIIQCIIINAIQMITTNYESNREKCINVNVWQNHIDFAIQQHNCHIIGA